MSANQFKYTDEFRDQSVDLLINSGKPLKQVARELGINASTLRSWRDRRIGTRSGGVAEAQGAETLEMKVKRLERENAYLRRQPEILKKAASILAEDPQAVCHDRLYAENIYSSRTVRNPRRFTQWLLCIEAVDRQ